MLATEEPTEGTARLRRFDGSHRRFLLRPSALRDEAGSSSDGTAGLLTLKIERGLKVPC
jgi:hypothetical protein